GLRARRPGEGQGHRLLHSVQRQHAVGGVAVLAQVAEAGGAVARLREGGGVEKGLAAHLAVVVAVAGGSGGQRDGHVQACGGEVGRIEGHPRLEAGEAAGEGLALVHAAEGQGRAFRLHVVGGGGGRGGQRAGDEQGGGQERNAHQRISSCVGAGGFSQPRGSIRDSVASPRNRWCQTAAKACASASTSSR